MSDIKHINPLYLALLEANKRMQYEISVDIMSCYSGGMVESYTKTPIDLIHHIENAIRYKRSMYHTSSLDKPIYTLMRREADSFYGLMSLNVDDWIKNQRYAFLKLFIKYRLQNCYKRRITV